MLHGRRYNEGMHQAIEAKEGVEIKNENQTLATITLQNYFRLYDKLAGMTGTAMTEAAEFHQIYKLGVVPIPTNKPMVRRRPGRPGLPDREAKFEAVVDDIAERHEKGQPVLVGTTSVEKSEILSRMLKRHGVPHEVLNAKYHEREAAIVAQAGRKGAVTVATNMAGRGTDIMLGGNPEFLADAELHQRGLSPVDTPEEYEAAWPEALEKAKAAVAEEHERSSKLGGLYVLGTERHESRRIDNQLRGRSGRQGDPGESRFYLSLDDDLMRLFNADMVEQVMEWLKTPPDVPIESKMVTRAIRSAQTQVEQQNFEIRKNVLKYDEVLNRQRKVIYAERRRVLEGEDLHEQIRAHDRRRDRGLRRRGDRRGLRRGVGPRPAVDRAQGALPGQAHRAGSGRGGRRRAGHDRRVPRRDHPGRRPGQLRRARGGARRRRSCASWSAGSCSSVLDRKWREHLYEMDYLQEGIGLRAMAQRDPLVEYQREGFDMFNAMMEGIKEESVGYLFNLEVEVQENPIVEEAAGPAPVTATSPPAVGGAPGSSPRTARAPGPRKASRNAAVPGAGPGRRAAGLVMGRAVMVRAAR